jgi:hypothetical protein
MQVLDPVNVASAFIPVAPAAKVAAWMADATMGGRIAVRGAEVELLVAVCEVELKRSLHGGNAPVASSVLVGAVNVV